MLENYKTLRQYGKTEIITYLPVWGDRESFIRCMTDLTQGQVEIAKGEVKYIAH